MWLMLLLLVPVGLATVIGLIVLWPSGEPTRAQQAALVASATRHDVSRRADRLRRGGRVRHRPDGAADAARPPSWRSWTARAPGISSRSNCRRRSSPPGCPTGTRSCSPATRGAEGGAAYDFFDYERDTPIIVLALAFAVVVGVVARLRGLASLVGLAFAFFVLLQFILPGLISGDSPTLVSLVGSAAIMFVVLYLAHGFSARTTTALVGTLFGLTLVAVLGSVSVSVARLTGLTSEETVTLQGYDPTLQLLRDRARRHRRRRPRRPQRRHHHPGIGDLAAERGVAGDHLARALHPRDDRRPRPHRLDRLHDRLRLRRRRAARCC